jgi:periplasmic divalent cation tolerance protein
MPSDIVVTLCTCPDESVANTIAERLVEEGLAACVSQLPGVKSVFLWQGKIEQDREVLLLIKTTSLRFDEVSRRIRELHPYDLPEIIAIPVSRGLPDYLNWVCQCTSTDS